MGNFARTAALSVLIASLCVAASFGWFSALDDAAHSGRFELSSRPPSGDLVFVEIDAASLQAVGVWPWPRAVHAQLLDRLLEMGARDVVFDVDFSAASTPEGDALFEAALQRAGGYAYLATFQQKLADDTVVMSEPLPAFAAQADSVLVNVDGDGTGLLESVPVGLRSIPTVAVRLVPGARTPSQSINIDYGIDLTAVPRVSASAVLDGTVDPAMLRDKQVVIGASAVELRDYFLVPRFGVIAGAMVQIAATETLKAGRALDDLGSLPAALAGLLAVLAITFAGRGVSVPQRAGLALTASIVVELVALLALQAGTISLDTTVFHCLVGVSVAGSFLSERARRWRQSRLQQARLAYLARHDDSSGALSRHALVERLTEGPAERGQRAIVAVRLLRFNAVSASLGHEVFDGLARAITSRLTQETGAIPARLESDIFAFAVEQDLGESRLIPSIDLLTAALEQPYQIDGHTIVLGTVFGVASQSDARRDTADVLQDAEIALSVAQTGQQHCVRYQSVHRQQIHDRRSRDLALRLALERNELFLVFQPQIDLKSGVMTGVEALIRWRNPELGLVSPAEFIPLAEETGLIIEIGDWILEEACRQIAGADWGGRLSINVSPLQLDNGGLVESVRKALRRSGLSPARLDIEITESVSVIASSRNVATLEELSAMGVSIAMDDFGTGYSSLSYLASLPIAKVKIDQSFVRNLPDAKSAVIIEAAVTMAHRLGKSVVAEGVETPDQSAYLRSIGCDVGQGYLYGRPAALADLSVRQKFVA